MASRLSQAAGDPTLLAASNRKRKTDAAATTPTTTTPMVVCPYLDTIQRSLLDFDLEPTCSVSLETGPHIYVCLVCGKYFRGRGPRTPAYTHAVEESHFCFVHLQKAKFYCLPDDYEIQDASLQDIRAALHPTFTEKEIAAIDNADEDDAADDPRKRSSTSRDLFGRPYLPGFVGMNNLHKTDCINAVVQALAHVPPLRDYFLRHHLDEVSSSSSSSSNKKTKKQKTATAAAAAAVSVNTSSLHKGAVAVTTAFGQVVRKLWSRDRFKSHVDPHILVQAISTASHKRFAVGQQAAADELLAWLLHQLHIGTGGGRKSGSSIIHKIFQGQVQVTTRRPVKKKMSGPVINTDQDDREGSDEEIKIEDGDDKNDQKDKTDGGKHEMEETTVNTHFLQLTLDIPEKPLFRDEDGGLVIPQEPLSTVLQKFDGMTFVDALSSSSSSSSSTQKNNNGAPQRKRYRLLKLPHYLILHLARFKTNRYSREKNPTIVAFPVKNLDLGAYTFPPGGKQTAPTEEQVRNMSIKEIKEMLLKYGQEDLVNSTVEKQELIQLAVDFAVTKLPDLLADKYDLVANITHESPADVGREGKVDPLQEGSYKCHVQHRGTKQWYELQDLHVQEIMPQQIGLSENYLLIFERKSVQVKRSWS